MAGFTEHRLCCAHAKDLHGECQAGLEGWNKSHLSRLQRPAGAVMHATSLVYTSIDCATSVSLTLTGLGYASLSLQSVNLCKTCGVASGTWQ